MKLIAAVDQNWSIGKNGEQLVYLREDLKHFRALTLGKCVILGRKTLFALPGGRPLPGRESIVLSRRADFSAEGARVCHSIGEVLAAAPEDAVVIGGGEVYRALLPYCSEALITKIDAAYPADCSLPDLDALPHWQASPASAPLVQDGITYRYVTYKRI